MEILDALEQKVTELLNEVAALRERNAELGTMSAGTAEAERDESEEIARLEEALKEERELREEALGRVSTLLRHLEELNSAS